MFEDIDKDKVLKWFAKHKESHQPFIYSSVDVRNSGFKCAPVDTNIFPAGFNLLNDKARAEATKQAQEFFNNNCPESKIVGLLAENFSRNSFYWENINALKEIFEATGKEIVIGVTDKEVAELNPQANLVEKKDGKLFFNGQSPCIIIANRDFSSGAPEELRDISQPVFPGVSMGWYRRRKTEHFAAYDKIAKQFAEDFNFDPWLITPYFTDCGNVNFKKREGLDCVATNVEKILHKIKKKYDEYGIDQEPYVFVKADSGTFGMGIMTVKSGDEIFEINKKARNKMSSIKEGVENTHLIIQEGIPSVDKVDDNAAEPVIYFVNGEIIGCFMRVNSEKDNLSNLNSKGMKFENFQGEQTETPCRKTVTGIVSSLAVLAAIHEREDLVDSQEAV